MSELWIQNNFCNIDQKKKSILKNLILNIAFMESGYIDSATDTINCKIAVSCVLFNFNYLQRFSSNKFVYHFFLYLMKHFKQKYEKAGWKENFLKDVISCVRWKHCHELCVCWTKILLHQ